MLWSQVFSKIIQCSATEWTLKKKKVWLTLALCCDYNSSLTFYHLNFGTSAYSRYRPSLLFQSINHTPLLFIHNLGLNASLVASLWSVVLIFSLSWVAWEGVFFSKVKLGWIWHLTGLIHCLAIFGLCPMLLLSQQKYHFVSCLLRSTELPSILWLLRKATFQKASGFKYTMLFVYST